MLRYIYVDEYLIDLNATQAAIRAGDSKATAYRIGFENLEKTSDSGGDCSGTSRACCCSCGSSRRLPEGCYQKRRDKIAFENPLRLSLVLRVRQDSPGRRRAPQRFP